MLYLCFSLLVLSVFAFFSLTVLAYVSFPQRNIIIADLSLHYFNKSTTKFLFNEIYRVLTPNGYLIARVNSLNDKQHIPVNAEEIENNFYYDGKIYKRFFEKNDFDILLSNFEICNLEEKDMSRYEKPKILWEICVKK